MKKETSKFKQLDNKQKLQYIWDYYKIHIIATAAIICIIFSITSTILKNKAVDLYVAYINIVTTDELLSSIDDATGLSISNYTDMLITEDPSGDDFQYAYASSVKLMSAISAGNLDIIVADSYGINMANSSEYLCNINDYLAKNNPALLNRLEPYFLYDKSGVPFAIDLSYSSLFNHAGFTEPVYLGIISSEDISPEVLEYLSLID